MSHPFGDLISQHLHRKHGLSQAKLAEGILQDPSIIGKMCKGERLNGHQARERVCAIINWLHQQAVLTTENEANGLLSAAGMAALRITEPTEAQLLQQLNVHAPASTLPTLLQAPVTLKPRTNLPAALTSFVGRAEAVMEIAQLVADHRLVTLTGAGGVGKTRLALEVGKAILDFRFGILDSASPQPANLKSKIQNLKFSDGIWLVELAAFGATDLGTTVVAQALIQRFKLTEQDSRSPLEVLQEYFANKHLLLVLDNCEHLVGGCAELCAALLQHCWQLHILTTSREELRISGEVLYPVPPLALPAPTEHDASDVLTCASAQLFVDRMRSTQPGLAIQPNDIEHLVHICRQLDGIPLALELAAPLARTMSLAEIAKQLDNQMALLTNRYRTTIPRHQTMYSALVWSYRLLAAEEQRLLAHVAVFAGGWTLEAAQAVCFDAASAVSPTDVASLLQQLNAKSWVLIEQVNEKRCYRLLEPVRHFAQHILLSMGELATTRQRHAHYFCAWLGEQAQALKGKQQRLALLAIETNWSNLIAAWHWAIRHQAIAALAQAVESLAFYYAESAQFQSGEIVHQQAIGTLLPQLIDSEQEDAIRLLIARLLAWQIHFSWEVGHKNEASKAAAQSIKLLEASRQDNAVARATQAFVLRQNAYLASFLNETQRAKALAEASLQTYQALGDYWGMALAHYSLGFVALDHHDRAAARQHYLVSLQFAEQLGDDIHRARALTALGWLEMADYQYDAARHWFAASLSLAEAQSHALGIGNEYQNLGLVDLAQGHFVRAAQHFQQSVVWFRQKKLRAGPATSLAYQGLAQMCSGKFGDTLTTLEASLAIATEVQAETEQALAHLFLSHLHLHLGDFARAARQAEFVVARISAEEEPWLIGYAHALLACVALVERNDGGAQHALTTAEIAFQTSKQIAYSAWIKTLWGYVAWQQGRGNEAYLHLSDAFQNVRATSAFFPLFSLYPLALLLAVESQKQTEALALAAQIKRLPLVTNSHWFAYMLGAPFAELNKPLFTQDISSTNPDDSILSFDEALTTLVRTFQEPARPLD